MACLALDARSRIHVRDKLRGHPVTWLYAVQEKNIRSMWVDR